MPTSLSPAEAEAFAETCRAFLDTHATGINLDDPDPRDEAAVAAAKVFQTALAEAGLAGLVYSREYGGQGLSPEHERIWRQTYAGYPDMTSAFIISHGMCLPMIAEYGTTEQKARYLPDMISGEQIWCQMFSEPNAGSDVASLSTKAVRDGDVWIINGQKVWTTLAHQSGYGILIARTDPSVPKHNGISMFIVDMASPGIEVRPIHQIDGGLHFNEVFFSDVAVPTDNLVGELNAGWGLAVSMLMYERVAIGTGSSSGVKAPNTRWLIRQARGNGRWEDTNVRQDLMRLYSVEATKSLVALRTRAEMKSGKTPGPGGSLGKLQGAVMAKMMRGIIASVHGSDTMAWEGEEGELASRSIVSTFMATIAGGTDEIQRNIIGDRVLGLPREPSVDKGVPFSELKLSS